MTSALYRCWIATSLYCSKHSMKNSNLREKTYVLAATLASNPQYNTTSLPNTIIPLLTATISRFVLWQQTSSCSLDDIHLSKVDRSLLPGPPSPTLAGLEACLSWYDPQGRRRVVQTDESKALRCRHTRLCFLWAHTSFSVIKGPERLL